MPVDYGTLFGRMCYFLSQPPLLFGIPDLPPEIMGRLTELQAPVELVVPDLDTFCIPESDLERIRWAVAAALALN